MKTYPPFNPEIVSAEIEQDLRSNRVIIPSNPDPWFGSWEDGEDLSFEQKRALAEAGISQPELTNVYIRTTDRQLYVPCTQKRPWRRLVCPVVQRRADGRPKVIAPNGDRKLVRADGSVPQAPERGGSSFYRAR